MAIALVLAACGDAEESAAPDDPAEVAEAATDDADGGVEVENDDSEGDSDAGSSSLTTTLSPGTIPDTFPPEMPLPDDYLVLRGASTTNVDGVENIDVVLITTGTVEAQRQFYTSELEAVYGGVVSQPELAGQPLIVAGDTFERGMVQVTAYDDAMDELYEDLDSTGFPVQVNISVGAAPED
ncbi:MAG: hypothetical protein ABR500_09440 [Dermatophilaceae bacterium]